MTKPETLATVDSGLATAPPEQLSLLNEAGKSESPSTGMPAAQAAAEETAERIAQTTPAPGDSQPAGEPAGTAAPEAADVISQPSPP